MVYFAASDLFGGEVLGIYMFFYMFLLLRRIVFIVWDARAI